MDIIMIPKKSHSTSMRKISYIDALLPRLRSLQRERTKSDWLLQTRSPANDCPVRLVLAATCSTGGILV